MNVTTPIKLIVGLGNPGVQYAMTRHNVGVWFLEKVAAIYDVNLNLEAKFHGFSGEIKIANVGSCRLLFPNTYMNHSGCAVQSLASFYKISPEHILVAHDELDFPPGTIRFKFGGGANGHNGLKDIIAALQSNGFHRLRIGIGKPQNNRNMADYVLEKPPRTEITEIDAALDNIMERIPHLLSGK